MALLNKKQKEPERIPSALNTKMLNYKVYYMKPKEKIITTLVLVALGGIIGLVFYGGLFLNEDGQATFATFVSNIVVFSVVGLITNLFVTPLREKSLVGKRQDELSRQFRSFLDALSVSLSSGMNTRESLSNAYNDLKVEYGEDAYICDEVREMISGLDNNIPLEDMIEFFGERSGIDDIASFGMVFKVCYRVGGNLKDVVRRTNDIIGEKMEINEEIKTALSSNKTQFSAMMVIPVVMVLMLRFMSSDFAKSFATSAGVIAMTIAIAIFFAAYLIGNKIMDIKG